ncbi:secreted RxLR effector protein 161-like [Cannabis sativa]|uniref:secreted RxLR effector protein 161-like n=1 Tax=Cannabis sativa TaxID=3483 RepID=UPI0029CA4989|nr:secreted RxLR effector protein 161-like [Cannabis sativa]
MHSCSFGKAPIVKGDKFSKAQCPQNDKERDEMKIVPYASLVGSLMYAQVCTRPDIAVVAGVLGTKDHMLTYRRANILDIVGFSDADYAGCVDDKRSTSDYIYMMDGGAVSWKSVKQTLIASSTMEAEYMACYEATC